MNSITLTSIKWMMVVISVLIAWAPTLSTQNQYCSISKDHTLCKFQGIGPRCKQPFEVGIPTRDRQLIMELHNNLRKTVATGAERRGRPGPQPTASNMRQMEWDEELALSAQRLAEQCKYTHDCLNCRKVDRFLTGQNLYQFSENLIREGSNWEQAIMAWYDEVALFNPKNIDYFDFIHELGHFTQMLWADTYKMGCGYVYYKDGKWNRKLYVCNYGPAGNVITTQMYKRGSPCSECPEGTSCSNQYPGLCSGGGGGGGRPFYAPAPTQAPAPVTPRPTQAPTRRTTTTTTTPRPTTQRPTTTTTRPSKIIFNEIESNEIDAFDNFKQNPIDISTRFGIPAKKTLQGSSSRNSFFNPQQQQSGNRYYQTTTVAAPRRITQQPNYSRFATTRKPAITSTTRRSYYTSLATTSRTTTKKPFTFSPRIYPEQNKNKQKNRFQHQSNTDYYTPTQRPQLNSQFNDNRISSGTINVPTTSNRFSSFNNNRQKIDPSQKINQPETKVLRMPETPALSVEDSNSILLFCDFDFAKCPVRYEGQLWNYTAYETPGYGHGFSTIVGPRGESNLQIRSDVYPSGSEGLICVHFRFVHYLFGLDGGPAKTNGLRPDGQPIKFIVTASTAKHVTTKVEISDRSKSAYDWLTGRIQFKDLHSQFLMNFQVPKNPLGDNLYLAVDDILITQGVCHT